MINWADSYSSSPLDGTLSLEINQCRSPQSFVTAPHPQLKHFGGVKTRTLLIPLSFSVLDGYSSPASHVHSTCIH